MGEIIQKQNSKSQKVTILLSNISLISVLFSTLAVNPTKANLREMSGSSHSLFTVEEDQSKSTGKFVHVPALVIWVSFDFPYILEAN